MPAYPLNQALRFLNLVETPIQKIFVIISSFEEELQKTMSQFPPEEQTDSFIELEKLHFKYRKRMEEIKKQPLSTTTFDVLFYTHNSFYLFSSHVFTLGVLYGVLFQIGKQLISFKCRESPKEVENGRKFEKGKNVGEIFLPQIIWDTRNQILHFEENLPGKNIKIKTNKKILETFRILKSKFGNEFDYETRPGINYARPVAKLIGWTETRQFLYDMEEILR